MTSNKLVLASKNDLHPKKSLIHIFVFFFLCQVLSKLFLKTPKETPTTPNTDHIHMRGDHDKNNWWFHLLAQLFRKIHYGHTLKFLRHREFIEYTTKIIEMLIRTSIVIGLFSIVCHGRGLPTPQHPSSESPGDWNVSTQLARQP